MSELVPGPGRLAGGPIERGAGRRRGSVGEAVLGPAVETLRRLHAGLEGYRAGDPRVVIPVSGLDEADLDLVDQALGVGEVGVRLSGAGAAEIDEAVFPGVWRVRPAEGEAHIEVSDFPSLAVRALETGTAPDLPVGDAPEGTMNLLPVLAEIRACMGTVRAGEPAHVINLTLLPVTLMDLALLDDALGVGPVTALSRGFGECRIASTARRHVWRVRHVDVDGRLILDTVEVVDVPVAARALQEDIDDGARRLGELVGAQG